MTNNEIAAYNAGRLAAVSRKMLPTYYTGNLAAAWKLGKYEGVTTLSGAHDILFKNMQTEIERLSRLVTALSSELNTVKKELAEKRRARLGCHL